MIRKHPFTSASFFRAYRCSLVSLLAEKLIGCPFVLKASNAATFLNSYESSLDRDPGKSDSEVFRFRIDSVQ